MAISTTLIAILSALSHGNANFVFDPSLGTAGLTSDGWDLSNGVNVAAEADTGLYVANLWVISGEATQDGECSVTYSYGSGGLNRFKITVLPPGTDTALAPYYDGVAGTIDVATTRPGDYPNQETSETFAVSSGSRIQFNHDNYGHGFNLLSIECDGTSLCSDPPSFVVNSDLCFISGCNATADASAECPLIENTLHCGTEYSNNPGACRYYSYTDMRDAPNDGTCATFCSNAGMSCVAGYQEPNDNSCPNDPNRPDKIECTTWTGDSDYHCECDSGSTAATSVLRPITFDGVDIIDSFTITNILEICDDVATNCADPSKWVFTLCGCPECLQTTAPSSDPTAVPSSKPTADPTADPTCEAQRHLNWAELLAQGADYESLPDVEYELDVDASTDTLSVDVYLPYLGSSQRNEDSATNLGTAYFIAFRAFSSDDAIANPGNCDNRDADAFVGKSWADSWSYDDAGASADSLGSAQFLAYGPSDFWSVSADARYADCAEHVHYAAELALPDLLGCADAEGERSIEVVTRDAWMNVSGSLFVSVLSPLTMSFESSSYLQYQLLSAPFSLSISKSVYLLSSTDTFVFSATPLAVYRESEGHYVMLLLTESAEFIALNGLSVLDPSMQSSAAAAAVDSECIAEQNYICSQVWAVDISEVACPFTLDGDYAFQFTAVCNDNDGNGIAAECDQFVQDNGDAVTLSAQLSFADTMCDAEVWTLQYEGAVAFYSDDSFAERADADAAYRSGADRIYVELSVDIPSSNAANQNFSLYDVELSNVWLCTVPSDVELTLDTAAVDSTGCFDPRVNGLSPYHIIQDHDATLSSGAAHEETDAVNTARFSFVVPPGVAEGAVYIEMQALLTLKGDGEDGRRRLQTDEEKTSSQLQLFMGAVTVSENVLVEEKQEVSASQDLEPTNGSPSNNAMWMVVVAFAIFSIAWIE